jgi:alpha-amylase/alpha-mannosidase (GH57 family)
MERHLCIHGHFYQPPRENPWLEAVEIQDSAYPYHDWNERITAECYATNASSRILDKNRLIIKIVNNFSRISFDLGPTLLSWLEREAPHVHEAIIEADRLGTARCSGHGPAMAQAFNHMIMPLSNDRDLKTQVEWGIVDFQSRFKRDPESMWLPETAVDIRSLEALAEAGIQFTVLAQHQASRFRPEGKHDWEDFNGGAIDPTKPYYCTLPSGKKIALFFYDGNISQAVAFEGLLKNGDEFAKRLVGGFSDNRHFPQLMHIATDGESYGHHHRFGDMALSYALDHIEQNELAVITNYGEFLSKHPPVDEVEIADNTSWSCSHGIERWKSDCGCSTGTHPTWNQKWRSSLREALDWLRDEVLDEWESAAAKHLISPWQARDSYINIILSRTDATFDDFIKEHTKGDLTKSEISQALALLELQRNAMLMYTSCGWFFDDISGIETVQVLMYAGRVIQLATKCLGMNPEDGFLTKLQHARSNIKHKKDGSHIYSNQVKPNVVSLSAVAAHFAISSVFEEYDSRASIYCYDIESLDYHKREAGGTVLVTGHCRVSSQITLNSREFIFGLVHLGGHDFNAGVRECSDPAEYRSVSDEIIETFDKGAFAVLVRVLDKHFGTRHFTLNHLFKDQRRHILKTLTQETSAAFEDSYRNMYQDNQLLMSFIKDTGMPVPKYFLIAADFTLNLDLKRLLKEEHDAEKVDEALKEMHKWGLSTDSVGLEFTFRRMLEKEMSVLVEEPHNLEMLVNIEHLLDTAMRLPFELNLWMMQNSYHQIARSVYPIMNEKALKGGAEEMKWVELFGKLGDRLHINLEEILVDTRADA